jgi:CO/xanthine dehydrogenase FAD-binding subunit
MRFDLYVPKSLNDLFRYLDKNRQATVIAGGTDLIPRIERRIVSPKLLVDISGLHELRYVDSRGDEIRIGAMTTISDLSESSALATCLEVFRQVSYRFGAPPIRNAATVGGSVAASSSSEDLIPVFLALDASVQLTSINGKRSLPLHKFLLGKRNVDLKPGELITEIAFRKMAKHSWCSFEKVGRRSSLIIALVSAAVFLELDPKQMTITQIRAAFNRVRGKIPERAPLTEEFLRGRQLNDGTVDKGLRILESELMLTTDYRASADYRTRAAKICFERALVHCRDKIIR